jgi:hypothetical protein
MAEKTIGIRLQLNGLNGVVKDIQTLEKFIGEAKADLKQLEIGSDLFKQLTKEISAAEGQLRRLNQQTEGLSGEKIAEGFGKLGAGISSSFAAATAAVSLFGSESEDVTKAAAEAQNLLTLALSIRGIMEIKTGAQIVARTIVEKASAAATVATDTATKALYATLAANPYTAILAAVGLLITAFVSFKSSTDEAAKAQKEFYDTVAKDAAKTISNYESLTAIVNDSSISVDRRKKALESLKQSFPGYFKNLKDEEILNGKVKVSIDNVKEAIVSRALANAYEDKLAEKLKQNTEARLKLAEREIIAQNLRKDALAEIQRIENDATITGKAFTNAIAAQSQLINQAYSIEVGIAEEREKLNKQDQVQIDIITTAIKAQTQLYGDLFDAETKETVAKKDNIAATQEQITQAYQLDKAFQQQVDELTKLAEAYNKIADLQKIDIEAPEVVQFTKQIVDARKALQNTDLAKIFKEIGFDISTANDQFKIVGDNLANAKDDFGTFYESVRKNLSEGAVTLSVKEFGEVVKEALNLASIRFQLGDITKEAFEAFKTLTDQYLGFNKVVADNPAFVPDTLKEFLDLEKQIRIAQGDYTNERDKSTGIISKEVKLVGDYTALIDKQNKLLEDYGNKLKTNYEEELKGLKLIGPEREKNIKQLEAAGKLTAEQAKDLLNVKTVEDAEKKLNEIIQKVVAARIEALKNVTQTIVQEENQIRDFLFQVQQNQQEGLKVSAEAVKNSLLNNLGLVIEFTQKQNKVVIDERKSVGTQLESLEQQLAKKGIDITKFTEEEKLKILKAYLEKQKADKDAAAEEDRKRGKITIETTQKILQEINNLVTKAASVTAQYFAFQLKKLDDENKKAQAQVVGDTEEANKKRLELESQYQKQKAEIEKRAQIRALQFQLAQAIAEGAQAVLSVIATPPLAIAVGALAAAQIAIIAQQLSYVQSLAGGGRIRMGAGGMITGPSHEMGGVSFAGGVNLEGGESVINRQSSLNYGGLLSTINESGGGRPLINNATGSLMEERLLQALAKERNTPIRAYVLSSEITNSQAINKKLDELSTI